MKRLIIFLKLSFFVVIANSQILFYPEIDSTSKDIYTLFKEKKINIAQQLVSKLIADNPNDGINYFNRAVLLFYKPGYPFSRKNPVSDGRIIVDCKKAIKLGYENSEIYYLLFSQYYNCDPNNEHIYSCRFDFQEESLEIRYEKLIALIDTAIEMNRYNEKYLWSEIRLFDQYRITSAFTFEAYKESIPTLRIDCERLLEITKTKKRRSCAYYFLAEGYKTFYKDSSKAIEYYTASIDIDKSFITSYLKRGELRKDFNKDYEGAIEDFNNYLLKFKDDGNVFVERAWCSFFLNKLNNSLKDLNIAISIYDQDRKDILTSNSVPLKLDFNQIQWGEAYYLRGLVNFYLKNEKGALKDLNKAIEYGSNEASEAKNDLFNLTEDDTQKSETFNARSNAVPMIEKSGVYEIPAIINDVLKINFVFDAGASDVSISPDIALTLIKTGTLNSEDFIGTQTYKFADGSTAKSKIFILKEVQIGNKKVANVKASISNSVDSPLLLGQSVLKRFGKVTIDYKNGVIHFED